MNMLRGYNNICSAEFSLLYSRVEHLFISVDIGCPYELPHVATFHQATIGRVGDRGLELFLAAGYRRNGNCLYNMHCIDCCACTPIRLHSREFQPNRNQRRTLAKNEDLVMSVFPLHPDPEAFELCEKFLKTRYPKENNSARGYYRDFFMNNITNSIQIQFRLQGCLVGTAIVDIGNNWMNAVYFFFDPAESHRSLGTQNILQLVELCKKWDIDYLYLGYLIHSVPAMSYKNNFKPHCIFVNNDWQTVVRK